MPPAIFRHYLKFQKRIIGEKRKRQALGRERVEALKARERYENQEILSNVLSQNTGLSRGDLDVLEIPSGLSTTSTPHDDRIRNYENHLRKMISQAEEYDDLMKTHADENGRLLLEETEKRFSEDSELQVISDRICGMCKGGCCSTGGDKAYISVVTIKRFMDENPNLTANEVLAAYLSKISSETISDACINQTDEGCSLPREMRSDTCNGFYCDSIRAWHDRALEERSHTVLAIQRCNSNWHKFNIDSLNTVVDVALVRTDSNIPCTFDIEHSEIES